MLRASNRRRHRARRQRDRASRRGLILQGGVDSSLVQWRPYDDLGRQVRIGLNFTERGFGVRDAVGVSDRGHTAASALSPGDVDWEHLFGTLGVRCLHTGGIFAALSATTAALAEEAMRVARRYGTTVSYDLNYRGQAFGRIAAVSPRRGT